jgi:hypothetical protein
MYSPDSSSALQDTVDRQLLLNGRVWRNLFYKVRGTQFLFSDSFIQGDVVINGRTFRDCSLKYDLVNDELLTKAGQNIIIQLNKEMVESFTLNYNLSVWTFVRPERDSLKELDGYVNLLYSGNSALYAKYRKVILLLSVDNKYDEFSQVQKIYLKKGGKLYSIGNKNDVIDLYSDFRQQIKSFLRTSKIKISRKQPESFVPLVRFCDKLGK